MKFTPLYLKYKINPFPFSPFKINLLDVIQEFTSVTQVSDVAQFKCVLTCLPCFYYTERCYVFDLDYCIVQYKKIS